jgi:hypothetical protein
LNLNIMNIKTATDQFCNRLQTRQR